MAEFTAIADTFHVTVTDGHRTAEYDIKAPVASEAIAEAKRRWAMRDVPVVAPPAESDPFPVEPTATPEPAPEAPAESGAPAA